jgi:hypothetical protein
VRALPDDDHAGRGQEEGCAEARDLVDDRLAQVGSAEPGRLRISRRRFRRSLVAHAFDHSLLGREPGGASEVDQISFRNRRYHNASGVDRTIVRRTAMTVIRGR